MCKGPVAEAETEEEVKEDTVTEVKPDSLEAVEEMVNKDVEETIASLVYYCKKFLMKTIQVGDRMERIYTTSSKLNKEQMTEFLNRIKDDALVELGIRLPEPNDRFFEQFYAQYNY